MGAIEKLERRRSLTMKIVLEELNYLRDELSDCPEWEPGKFLPGLLEDAIVRLEELA